MRRRMVSYRAGPLLRYQEQAFRHRGRRQPEQRFRASQFASVSKSDMEDALREETQLAGDAQSLAGGRFRPDALVGGNYIGMMRRKGVPEIISSPRYTA